jgi:hypothetical protein
MRKSHDPRRDLIDTCAASEHLFDAEAHIAQSHCAAVNRDLLAALKWLVWAVDRGGWANSDSAISGFSA